MDPAQKLDIGNALALLGRQDARKACLLELIYFGGLYIEETAEAVAKILENPIL